MFADVTSNDYITNKERFQGQAFELERDQRQKQYLQKQHMFERKREEKLRDYQDRLRKAELDSSNAKQKLVARASKWGMGMKNNPSAAFNPITLDYHSTEMGRQLRHKDMLQNQRQGQRMYNLDIRQNCGYNPVTGQPRYVVPQNRSFS